MTRTAATPSPPDHECPEDTVYHISTPQERTYPNHDVPVQVLVFLKQTDLLPDIATYGTEVFLRVFADGGVEARLTPETAEDLGHVLIANAAKARGLDQ